MNQTKNPSIKEGKPDLANPDLKSVEKKLEESKKTEAKEQFTEKPVDLGSEKKPTVESDVLSQAQAGTKKTPHKAFQKTVVLKQIESVLQDDLEEIYFNMDEAHRNLFKAEGERVSKEIEHVVTTGQNIAMKVLELIKGWLKLIPGVNKFFLEQEAKIKTDKIINIHSKK
jgi:hypothetical protein